MRKEEKRLEKKKRSPEGIKLNSYKEQPIKWFPNSADRFIQLLKTLSWNDAVRQLRAEIERDKAGWVK